MYKFYAMLLDLSEKTNIRQEILHKSYQKEKKLYPPFTKIKKLKPHSRNYVINL